MSHRRLLLPAALLVASLTSVPAFATSKDMIQLQTQVQQLQDAVARLQQSNDENMGVLKDLVQQTSDAVNKMSASMAGLKLQMQNQQTASGTTNQQLSGQIQALNDSIDELQARMGRMEKNIGDIQSQQQSIGAALSNLPQTTATPTATAPGSTPPPADSQPPSDNSAAPQDNSAIPSTSSVIAPVASAAPAAPSAPPIGDLYRTAYGDYVAGKYTLASSEFQQLATAYPDDNLSGNAYFYMGEIDLRLHKPSVAIKMYDHVIEHFPDNVKIPAARLHKADALIAMRENPAAIRELRALIQRFPISPEASAAHAKLAALTHR
jgi:TolA-binding protein